jgi:hypothetical protein
MEFCSELERVRALRLESEISIAYSEKSVNRQIEDRSLHLVRSTQLWRGHRMFSWVSDGFGLTFGRMRAFQSLCLIGLWSIASFMILPTAALERKAIAMPETEGHGIAITTIFDNYAADPRLATSWGFAAAIVTAGTTMLFDTGGNGSVLLANMSQMNFDPEVIQAVVISHVHRDHLGGLEGFLAANRDVMVYIPASFPDAIRRMIRGAGADFTDITGPTEVAPDIITTGPLGDGLDEQALVVDTDEGLVVITGCAHPGIVRIVELAHTLRPGRPIA